jgi:hypothetical protein
MVKFKILTKMKSIICPVSTEQVNEKITRLNALITVIIASAGILFQSPVFFIFLASDFFIRGFTNLKLSPIGFASSHLANSLKLRPKQIGKAPKVFAARLGFLLTFSISLFLALGFPFMTILLTGLLILFALLEFSLAICAGCLIYTYTVLPFFGPKDL